MTLPSLFRNVASYFRHERYLSGASETGRLSICGPPTWNHPNSRPAVWQWEERPGPQSFEMKYKREPVMQEMCATCPFRPEGLTELAPYLAKQAMTVSSRICHSTGANNAINRRTGKKPHLCRGARDVQLKAFFAMKVISAPTDAAWEVKCQEMGIP